MPSTSCRLWTSAALQVGIVIVLAFALPTPGQGQADTALIGERVRVKHCGTTDSTGASTRGPCRRTVGELVAISSDALSVQMSGGEVSEISRAHFRTLERSLGTGRSTRKGAVTGGAIGLGFGVLISVLVLVEDDNAGAAPVILGSPLVGAAVGGLIGAGIGSLPREKWKRVMMARQVSVAFVGGRGGVGVGARIPI